MKKAEVASGAIGQAGQLLRGQGHLGTCDEVMSPLCQLGLFPGQVALAQRWGKLQGPQPPGVLEQAPLWSALGVHRCYLHLGAQDLSLGPASGAENPVRRLPMVPQVTRGSWVGGCPQGWAGCTSAGSLPNGNSSYCSRH